MNTTGHGALILNIPLPLSAKLLRKVVQMFSMACCCVSAAGCGVIQKRPESKPSDFQVIGKPMPPEKAKQVLSEIGKNFAYGPGLGDAAVNIGAVVVFPPYAIYLLGNAALSLSGYEPITISAVLPSDDGKAWSDTYDTIVSGPGKMVAAMAGHEYRSREVADAKMQTILKSIEQTDSNQSKAQAIP